MGIMNYGVRRWLSITLLMAAGQCDIWSDSSSSSSSVLIVIGCHRLDSSIFSEIQISHS